MKNWLPQTQAEAKAQPYVADHVWQAIDAARRLCASLPVAQENESVWANQMERERREARIQAQIDAEMQWFEQ